MLGRQQFRQDIKALAARAAISFDQRARGGAEAGATDRIPQELEQRRVELATVSHLNRGVVVEERPRNLGEILHVRTKDDWLPEDRRFQDIVATSVDEAAANEDRSRDLKEL